MGREELDVDDYSEDELVWYFGSDIIEAVGNPVTDFLKPSKLKNMEHPEKDQRLDRDSIENVLDELTEVLENLERMKENRFQGNSYKFNEEELVEEINDLYADIYRDRMEEEDGRDVNPGKALQDIADKNSAARIWYFDRRL